MSGHAQGQGHQQQHAHPGDSWVQRMSKGKHDPARQRPGAGAAGGGHQAAPAAPPAGGGHVPNLIQVFGNPAETHKILVRVDELNAKGAKAVVLHGQHKDLQKEVVAPIAAQLTHAADTLRHVCKSCFEAVQEIRNPSVAARISDFLKGQSAGTVADEIMASASKAGHGIAKAKQAAGQHHLAAAHEGIVEAAHLIQSGMEMAARYHGKTAEGADMAAKALKGTRDSCIVALGVLAPGAGVWYAAAAGALPALAKLQDKAVAHEPIDWAEFTVDAVAGAVLGRYGGAIDGKLGHLLEGHLGQIGEKLVASGKLKPEQVKWLIEKAKDKIPDFCKQKAHDLAVGIATAATEREKKNQHATPGSLRKQLDELVHDGKIPDGTADKLKGYLDNFVTAQLKKQFSPANAAHH